MSPSEPGKRPVVHRAVMGFCRFRVPGCPEGARERIAAWTAAGAECTRYGTCAKVCPTDALEVMDETGV